MQQQEFKLDHYLRLLWKSKWLILLTTIVAFVSVAGFTHFQPPPVPSYQSIAAIAVEPMLPPEQLSDILSFPSGDGNPSTQVQLLESPQVIDRALEKLRGSPDGSPANFGSPQGVALREAISVSSVPNTNLLELVAKAPTSELAQRRADAMIESYMDNLRAERIRVFQSSLAEVTAQLQGPKDERELRERAAILLPALGADLENIVRSVEASSQALAQLQIHRPPEENIPSPSVESMEMDLEFADVAADLISVSEGLQSITEKLQGPGPGFTTTESPFSSEVQKIEQVVANLNSTSHEIRDIRTAVRGIDPSPILKSMANKVENVKVALREAAIELDGARANGLATSASIQLHAVEAYVDTLSDDARDLETRFRRSADKSAAFPESEKISIKGLALALSLGFQEAGDDLVDLRDEIDLGSIGNIVAAEGYLKAATVQIDILVNDLDDMVDTDLLYSGLTEVLDWTQRSSNDLQTVSESFLSPDALAGSQNRQNIAVQASRGIDDVTLTLGVAIARLRSLQTGSSAPLLEARLDALSKALTTTQRTIAGTSARLGPNAQAITLVDGIGVVQKKTQQAADRLQSLVPASSHLSSTPPESDRLRVHTVTSEIVRSLDIASRQLQGLLFSVTDPLVKGELGPLTEDLAVSHGRLKRLAEQLADVIADNGTDTPQETVLLPDQIKTAANILKAGSKAVMEAAGKTQQGPDNQEMVIYLDAVSRGKEQTDAAAAVLSRVVAGIAGLAAAEGDLLRYGRLTVLEQRITKAWEQTTEVATQLQQVQEKRGPINIELRQLQQQLELALLQPQDTGVTLVGSTVSSQPLEPTFFSGARIPLGAAAGLLLGILAVLIRGQMDQTLRTPGQLREQLGLASLGVVPKRKASGDPQLPMVSTEDRSCFSEGLRMVGTNTLRPLSDGARTLLITSPSAQEGKTMLAVNLAQVLAQHGRKVLLVDANLRKPEVAGVLHLSTVEGLATALSQQRNPADYIVTTDAFSVLPGGEPASNPIELISSPAMASFLQEAQKEYDVVLLDSPPAAGFAETKALAKEVDGTILVVRAGATTVDAIKQLKAEMEEAEISIVGTVLNFAGDEECAQLRHETYGPYPAT